MGTRDCTRCELVWDGVRWGDWKGIRSRGFGSAHTRTMISWLIKSEGQGPNKLQNRNGTANSFTFPGLRQSWQLSFQGRYANRCFGRMSILPWLSQGAGTTNWFAEGFSTCVQTPPPKGTIFWPQDTILSEIDQIGVPEKHRKVFPRNVFWLWGAQIESINKLEKSLAENKPRALIQMATGSGKIFTTVHGPRFDLSENLKI